MAAELGFEPRHTESESAVLPLHNSALLLRLIILSQGFIFVKGVFSIFCKKSSFPIKRYIARLCGARSFGAFASITVRYSVYARGVFMRVIIGCVFIAVCLGEMNFHGGGAARGLLGGL